MTDSTREPFVTCSSRAVLLIVDNVDTDQIIPARFLKTTTRDGLGRHLFHDWRYDSDGCEKRGFVLNHAGAAGCRILIAGHNFGCGSSREHAPWALAEFGFRAVISTGFADIFRQNALKNGVLPVAISNKAHRQLVAAITTDASVQVTVDLERQTVMVPSIAEIPFSVDPFARTCLLAGIDEIGYVLSHADAIRAYEEAHDAE